jgi:hypothetical protein
MSKETPEQQANPQANPQASPQADPLETLRQRARQGDGGGEVWGQIMARLEAAPGQPARPLDLRNLRDPLSPPTPAGWGSGLWQRLLQRPLQRPLQWRSSWLRRWRLDGTVVEAAVRFPGPAPVLALLAALSLLAGALLGHSHGAAGAMVFLLAPACALLAGVWGLYDLDPASELTRSSSSLRLLLLARQSLVYGVLALILAPGLLLWPTALAGLWLWLLASLLLNAVALALALRWGNDVGLVGAAGLWLWLALLHLPSEQQRYVPSFIDPLGQLLLLAALLAWSLWQAEHKPSA